MTSEAELVLCPGASAYCPPGCEHRRIHREMLSCNGGYCWDHPGCRTGGCQPYRPGVVA